MQQHHLITRHELLNVTKAKDMFDHEELTKLFREDFFFVKLSDDQNASKYSPKLLWTFFITLQIVLIPSKLQT